MYKLLIVDDEPLMQMGITSMIQMNHMDIQICGNASNGWEALEKIRELSPKIVICDIKMPMMDGLELAEKSREIYGRLPVFIMLTAYEEFELAKKAILCQVIDYLVKIELTPEILSEALLKASRQVQEYSRDSSAPALHTFYDKFFMRLLNNLLSPDAIDRHARELSINLNYPCFVAASGHIHVSSGTDGVLDSSQYLNLHSSSINMLREILKKYVSCYLVSLDTRHFAVIFNLENDENLYSLIKDGLEDAVSLLKSYFSIRITLGVGTAARLPWDIHISFQEAKKAEEFSGEKTPFVFYRDIVEQNRISEKGKLISQVQDYINQHLTERLSLNAVADLFYLSPGYLSTTFKKHCGMSFTEYINCQKISLAKDLLLKQEMKIYEIAAFLGFENTYYFSKVFKKISGMSPSEFVADKLSSFL